MLIEFESSDLSQPVKLRLVRLVAVVLCLFFFFDFLLRGRGSVEGRGLFKRQRGCMLLRSQSLESKKHVIDVSQETQRGMLRKERPPWAVSCPIPTQLDL